MEINRANLKAFREDFDEHMKSLEKFYSVKIELGRIRFDSTTFRGKLTVVNADPKSLQRQAATTKKLLTTASDGKYNLGMKFRHNSTIYTIVEFKPSRPKYPFIVTTQRGARYKMSAQHLSIMEVVK